MNTDLRPLSEQTKDAVDKAIEKIMLFHTMIPKSDFQGIMNLIDKKLLEDRNNIFEYGILLYCSGCSYEHIKEILQNIIKLRESSYMQKIIDPLYIIGVLGIQSGVKENILIQRLDSYIPEQCRSEKLKKRITEINLGIINSKGDDK